MDTISQQAANLRQQWEADPRWADIARTYTAEDVIRAISLGVAQQVSVLGTLVEDTQTWDDIVLPADTREPVLLRSWDDRQRTP